MPRIDRKELKSNIHRKFGSLTNFSKVVGVNYNKLLRVLNTPNFTGDEIHDIQRSYLDNDISNGVDGLINDIDRERIRVAIMVKHSSYTDFCIHNEEYDVVYLTNVIRGNLKYETEKYIDLINLLKEEYNYDEFIEKIR